MIRQDRWAHRRGEPRVFAFLWTLYLMSATMLAFASVGARGQVPVDVYRPVARMLLVTVVLGIVVVWPMARLCQARPPRSSAWAALVDFLIVLLPVQAIVWPQGWLTAWPIEVLTGLATVMASWGMLVAGILALALRAGVRGPDAGELGPGVAARALWMGLMIVLAVGGVALGALAGFAAQWPAFASPLTAVYALTADQPVGGLGHSVTGWQWRIILIPGGVGAAAWLGALLSEVWPKEAAGFGRGYSAAGKAMGVE